MGKKSQQGDQVKSKPGSGSGSGSGQTGGKGK